MKLRLIGSAVVTALAFFAGDPGHAQDVPRTANGKPDFSGIYTPPATVNATGPRGNLIFNADKMAPVKPGAESLLYRMRTGDVRLDEPRAACLPSGFPSGMLYILPIQIVQNPKNIVIIPELQRAARIIPTDGRPHREGIEPTYYGDSGGKWEGDTLVIDSVGFNESFWMDRRGMPHTTQLHTIERFTRKDAETITFEITVDDPGAYTAPWTSGYTLGWQKGNELFEYQCQENNLSPESMAGDSLVSPITP